MLLILFMRSLVLRLNDEHRYSFIVLGPSAEGSTTQAEVAYSPDYYKTISNFKVERSYLRPVLISHREPARPGLTIVAVRKPQLGQFSPLGLLNVADGFFNLFVTALDN
jgi:hypothetical protein